MRATVRLMSIPVESVGDGRSRSLDQNHCWFEPGKSDTTQRVRSSVWQNGRAALTVQS